jgi:hypothetical protein
MTTLILSMCTPGRTNSTHRMDGGGGTMSRAKSTVRVYEAVYALASLLAGREIAAMEDRF